MSGRSDGVKKLLKYMKKYKARCILAPTFKMLEAASELFVPLVVADIIDKGIAFSDKSYIVSKCFLLIILAVLGLSFTVAAQYFSATAAVGFTANIKKALFRHIASLEYKDIDRLGTDSLITRMTGDINQIQNGVNLTLRLFARSPFIVFGAAVMAFTVDARSALVFVAVIPVLTAVVFAVMLYSIPLFKKVQLRIEKLTGAVREYLYGVRLIRSFRTDKAEKEKFDKRNDAALKISVFAGKVSALMNPLTYVIINLGIIALLGVGAKGVNASRLTSGEVVALYNYMSQILIELLKLANLVITVSKALSAASRVEQLFDVQSCENGDALLTDSTRNDNAIEIENMSFAYENAGESALRNISLTVGKGETLGIIGPTGSGKTTLVNLICGYYTATEGEIKIYGKDVSQYDRYSLRKAMHIVPQKSVLFRGTVRDNLLFGADAPDDELMKSVRIAQAEDFLKAKDGLDTKIGEEGAGLSGGQKQRLAIARALVGSPDFLILDDSSSALDLATDKALRQALEAVEPKPTTIIVSQRALSVMNADKIIVLCDGDAVGTGTHEELFASNELYREIYFSQFGEDSLSTSEIKEAKV